MKIVLAIEQGNAQPVAERTFETAVIRVGRDANNADLVFDNTQFRMVSRHHADIRYTGGKWLVGDMGSSFGTILNGNKIKKPSELKVGSSVQFGEGGPRIHVIWLEGNSAENTSGNDSPDRRQLEQPPPRIPVRESSTAGSDPLPEKDLVQRTEDGQEAEPPRLILTGGDSSSEFPIVRDSFWLGRDPGCDVVIEASAVVVSRRHAEIVRDKNAWLLRDNQSFNGTLVNGHRISLPTPLCDKDEIRLGHGGPLLIFAGDSGRSEKAGKLATAANASEKGKPEKVPSGPDYSGTMVFNLPSSAPGRTSESNRQLIYQLDLDERSELLVGRNPECDITLDGLQISNRHARLRAQGPDIQIEDLKSTNGVYVNGERTQKSLLRPGESAQIGTFVIETDEYGQICVYDTRSKTRIDAIGITEIVKNRAGGGKITLLDDISLTINPNEFVGLIGPSGAGKSTLINVLNGISSPSSGTVYVNGKDLFRYIDHLKQSIGYVPQEEIIHGGLTVWKSLYFIAKLRLSRDVSRREIDKIIAEVLDVCGLTERRDVLIDDLSGGQRKRVTIAVELITKPAVIYLDEPTSGLDPATEEKIMSLFRQIAETGRTVVLTTHAMENIRLFYKIIVLMSGKLVFYGPPAEALSHFGVGSYTKLFDRLEETVHDPAITHEERKRPGITDKVSSGWRDKFKQTPQYRAYVERPLTEISESGFTGARKRNGLGVFGSVRQLITLSRRYTDILLRDRFNLFVLFAQAPVIAVLVYFVMGDKLPRDFAYFALSLCSIWFGTSVAAREIVRERHIYERERMVNLGIIPYLASKYLVLGLIVALQCFLLFAPLKFLDLAGLMPMPGLFAGIPQFVAMLITAAVGVSVGLFISSIVRTSETATSLIPLVLIPQIIFSGLIGVPTGINKVVGLSMPAAWSFDTMKRFSTLDTLEPEGSFKKGSTNGMGLYKSIESKNDKIIADAKSDIKEYEKDLEKRLQEAERSTGDEEQATFTGLPRRPEIASASRIPEDLSMYITFLNPLMNEYLNPAVLLMMLAFFFISTMIALKVQDIL